MMDDTPDLPLTSALTIGERPAGTTPQTSDIVVLTAAAISALGMKPEHQDSSTDSNVPMSLGIPAITIPRAATGERGHSVSEWIDVSAEPSLQVKRMDLVALLAAAGYR